MLADLRYAFRALLRAPAFASAALIALALGIGANTAMFSIADATFLRPLPYEDPGRLVIVWMRNEPQYQAERRKQLANNPTAAERPPGVSGIAFLDWRAHNRVFTDMAAIDTSNTRALFSAGGESREAQVAPVSASFLPLLGIEPALGRNFTEAEDRPGGAPVAIISHAMWQTRFGGSPTVLGRAVTLDEKPATIIGVAPARFEYPQGTEIWRPIAVGSRDGDMYPNQRNFRVVARLRPGVTVAQARADITVRAAFLAAADTNAPRGESGQVMPLHEFHFGSMRRGAVVLLGAVGFVLLIACSNVANLILARSAARQRELAIRNALGAGRWRILRHLMTETALLAVAGGVGGAVLAMWSLDSLKTLLPPNIPRADEIAINARVLWFTLAASLLTAVIAGLAPALSSSDIGSLNQTARATPGRAGMRKAFVMVQVTLALVLLAGAGLMINTFVRLMTVDRGFDSAHRLTARLTLPDVNSFAETAKWAERVRQVVERTRAIPGVRSAATVFPLPFSGAQQRIGIVLEGQQFEADPSVLSPAERRAWVRRVGDMPSANYRGVTPDYFRAMGIALIRGRVFDDGDTAGRPPVAIVNETTARTMWPNQDAIGKRFKIMSGPSPRPFYEVVGIVRDVKHQGLEFASGPEMYLAYYQRPQHRTAFLVLHLDGKQPHVPGALRSTIASIDKTQPVEDVFTMDEQISKSLAPRRFYLVLLGLFAGLAITLAAVGIYGVVAYQVAERTREIGIRIAIGARPESVQRMVLGQAMRLTAFGAVAGLAGALALSRFLSSFLYGVKPSDPLTYAVVVLALAAVAAAAAWIPARRAAKVDPILALRCE